MSLYSYIDTTRLDKDRIVIDTKLPVYITMTTTPSRIANTFTIIKNFLKNVRGFEKIILNVPYKYERWPNYRPNVQMFNSIDDPRFILNRSQDDGPLTKLLGSIDIIPNRSITVICDDMCYNNVSFKEIAELQDKNRNSAFSFHVYKYKDIEVPQGADLISCYSGNLKDIKRWRNKMISTLDKKEYKDSKCFFVDDLVIGWYLRSKNIKIEQVARSNKHVYIDKCDFDRSQNELNKLKGENSRKSTMNTCYIDLNTFNPF